MGELKPHACAQHRGTCAHTGKGTAGAVKGRQGVPGDRVRQWKDFHPIPNASAFRQRAWTTPEVASLALGWK